MVSGKAPVCRPFSTIPMWLLGTYGTKVLESNELGFLFQRMDRDNTATSAFKLALVLVFNLKFNALCRANFNMY